MKKLLLKLILVGCAFGANAQITFQKTYGGTGDDSAPSIQQTTDGGYIMVGTTDSMSISNDDVYLIKTNASGDTLWTKTFGGTNNDYGNSLQQTSDGGYVITGISSSFGSGNGDVYLIKTDANGNSQWAKTFGGTNPDYGNYVGQTSDSGYIITGHTLSFSVFGNDVYLIKTDLNGNLLWSKTFGGTSEDRGLCVHQTSDGGYIVTGYTNSFAAGSIGFDVYLIKTDANGNSFWTKTYGGLNSDYAISVEQTTDGGYIIAGHSQSFGVGYADVYLLKIDSIGNSVWSKTFGGTGYDSGHTVKQTTDGGYIVAGTTVSFSTGNYDVYLIKTNVNGDSLWTKTFGGTLDDWGNSVEQTTDGGYIITGYTLNFGTGNFDIYLIKTDSLGNSGCNQSNPPTIVTTPATVVTTPATIVTSPATIVTTPATIIGSGGVVTTLCTTVGIQSEIKNPQSAIFISPNPTSGNFKINYTLPQNKEGSLQILDVTGKTIYTHNLPKWSTLQNISLPTIANGIYNCVITCGETRVNKKLVVVR